MADDSAKPVADEILIMVAKACVEPYNIQYSSSAIGARIGGSGLEEMDRLSAVSKLFREEIRKALIEKFKGQLSVVETSNIGSVLRTLSHPIMPSLFGGVKLLVLSQPETANRSFNAIRRHPTAVFPNLEFIKIFTSGGYIPVSRELLIVRRMYDAQCLGLVAHIRANLEVVVGVRRRFSVVFPAAQLQVSTTITTNDAMIVIIMDLLANTVVDFDVIETGYWAAGQGVC